MLHRLPLGLVALTTLLLACTGDKGPATPDEGTPKGDGRALDGGRETTLPGAVVASASDGAFVLRDSAAVRVRGARDAEAWALPGVTLTDEPGLWFAVSRGASHAAHVNATGGVEFWRRGAAQPAFVFDGASLAFEAPIVPFFEGHAPERDNWGAPVFLGDKLATHHDEGVVLWDLELGKAHCYLTEPLIRLARETFDLGDGRAALRSNSNTPDLINAALIEFTTADCEVTRTHLLPVNDTYRVAASTEGTLVLHAGALRVLPRDAPARSLALPMERPHAIGVRDDGLVAWAGDGAEKGRVDVGVIDPKSGKFKLVGKLAPDVFVMHLRLERERVVAIAQRSGGPAVEHVWPAPSLEGASVTTVTEVSADERARERALIAIGRGDRTGAIDALEGRQRPAPKGVPGQTNRFLHAYLESFDPEQSEEEFRARLARDGIGIAGDPSLFVAIEHLVAIQAWPQATDLFFYWVREAPAKSLPQRAVAVGLELSEQLSAAERSDLQEKLLTLLEEQWPDDKAIADMLRDLE